MLQSEELLSKPASAIFVNPNAWKELMSQVITFL